MSDVDEIREKMKSAMPHFRHAMRLAQAEAGDGGKVGIGVIAIQKDGKEGRITARFEAPEFFEDIATLLGLGLDTEDEEMDARAVHFLDSLGLRKREEPSGGTER